jgi:hypothetical protein
MLRVRAERHVSSQQPSARGMGKIGRRNTYVNKLASSCTLVRGMVRQARMFQMRSVLLSRWH